MQVHVLPNGTYQTACIHQSPANKYKITWYMKFKDVHSLPEKEKHIIWPLHSHSICSFVKKKNTQPYIKALYSGIQLHYQLVAMIYYIITDIQH